MIFKSKLCILCKKIYAPHANKQYYCDICRESGNARKDINSKYNHSFKATKTRYDWYHSHIAQARASKRRWDQTEQGKDLRRKWYLEHKTQVLRSYLTPENRKKISGRTQAKRKVRREGWKKICDICSDINRIELHHKDKNPLNNNLANLVYLCKPCHTEVHVQIRLANIVV